MTRHIPLGGKLQRGGEPGCMPFVLPVVLALLLKATRKRINKRSGGPTR